MTALEEAWISLMTQEPELCIRMLTVRYMMEDRGLTGPDVATHLGITRQRVSHALNPRYVRYPGATPFSGAGTVSHTHGLLDRIEDAITELTEPPTSDPTWWDEVRRDRAREVRDA